MSDPPSSYRLSSARRSGAKDNPVLVLAVFGVLAVIVLVVALSTRRPEAEPAARPTSTPTPARTATPTPVATPTEGLVQEASGWVDATVILPPSPTPTDPVFAPAPTREPRPTPRISQCASYTWSSLQVFTPSAQVKIDIRVDNRCPYDLGPSNLLFEITGWRDGGRVQTVRGVPFETIRRGRTGELSIGLPGSLDWYDEIEVSVFD